MPDVLDPISADALGLLRSLVGVEKLAVKGRVKLARDLCGRGLAIGNPGFTSIAISKAGRYCVENSNV